MATTAPTPTKPTYLKPDPAGIPTELKLRDQWLLWKAERSKKGKWTKVPYQVNGRSKADTTRPQTWAAFNDALRAYRMGRGDGIGFVFTDEDPYVGIDLDHVLASGSLLGPYAGIVEAFDSYTERSVSGDGLHIIVEVKSKSILYRRDDDGNIIITKDGKPEGRGRKRDDEETGCGYECYGSARFFAFTGAVWDGHSEIASGKDREVLAFIEDYIEVKPKEEPKSKRSLAEHCGDPPDDNEAIRLVTTVDKRCATWAALWAGNWEGLGYPSQSEADQALMNKLAFYCGKDEAQMERLFRRSGLYREDEQHKIKYTVKTAVADTNSVYTPSRRKQSGTTTDAKTSGRPELRNYIFREVNGETVTEAVPLTEISDTMLSITGGWPKRLDDGLMFVDQGGAVRFLETRHHLFAYLGERSDLYWKSGGGSDGRTLTPKDEYHAHLQDRLEAFEAVEELPHQPHLPRTYYAWKPPADYRANGQYLARLLGYFTNLEDPAVDGALLKAAFLTPAWGGMPGTRPAQAIMASQPSCGKTTLADAIGELYGGVVEVQPDGQNEDQIMCRLLTPGAMKQRCVSIDNIRQSISSALIESIITKPWISGKRMYHGEARRPNTLTWILTGNCLRLSRDMSERSFLLRLVKPEPVHGWREDLFTFLRQNRARILADVVQALQTPAVKPNATDRWQSWVDGVLCCCTSDPAAVVAKNAERRYESDDDREEAEIVLDVLRYHFATTNADMIYSSVLAKKLSDTFGEHWSARQTSLRVRAHIESGRIRGLKWDKDRNGRGFRRLMEWSNNA